MARESARNLTEPEKLGRSRGVLRKKLCSVFAAPRLPQLGRTGYRRCPGAPRSNGKHVAKTQVARRVENRLLQEAELPFTRNIPKQNSQMPYSNRSRRKISDRKRLAAQAAEDCLPLNNFTNGRMLAWHAVQQFDATGRFLSEILADADSMHNLSPQERGLAVDLSLGVIRRRRTVDTILESQISRPRSNVESDLWTLLQLGTYQLAFSRTPDHAAVDTIVELAKTAGQARWCGFANGVLRNVGRLLTEDYIDQPSATSIPISEHIYRRVNETILPDPTTELIEYIGKAFSLPRSLSRRWGTRMTRPELFKACFHSIDVPVTVLRVNRLLTTVAQVQSALEETGVEVKPGDNEWSLRITHASRITALPGYAEGWWSVQDESAMRAAEILAPVAGERILDLCAAPGGKSTQMAELSGDKASILACDVSESRLKRISESTERLKLNSIEPMLIDRYGNDIPEGEFDAALVDVPCSNTGVLSRRPEARWRFREDEMNELVLLQTRLLLTAFGAVRPGGRIIYSTCSIEPEETNLLIGQVTQMVPGLKCLKHQLQLPGRPSDGAFQALLLKEDTRRV